MAFLEDVSRHLQVLSDNPFDRVTPSVDARVNVFDDNGWQTFQVSLFVLTRVSTGFGSIRKIG